MKPPILSLVLGALVTIAIAVIASLLFGRSLLWIVLGAAIGGAVAVGRSRGPSA
jgi:hypothetical protein